MAVVVRKNNDLSIFGLTLFYPLVVVIGLFLCVRLASVYLKYRQSFAYFECEGPKDMR